MSLEAFKRELTALSPTEQSEVTAFLFHLRHAAGENADDYQAAVARRLTDHDPARWLTPEEFERRLDGR